MLVQNGEERREDKVKRQEPVEALFFVLCYYFCAQKKNESQDEQTKVKGKDELGREPLLRRGKEKVSKRENNNPQTGLGTHQFFPLVRHLLTYYNHPSLPCPPIFPTSTQGQALSVRRLRMRNKGPRSPVRGFL